MRYKAFEGGGGVVKIKIKVTTTNEHQKSLKQMCPRSMFAGLACTNINFVECILNKIVFLHLLGIVHIISNYSIIIFTFGHMTLDRPKCCFQKLSSKNNIEHLIILNY